jgi:hypothetical protein
MIGFVIFGVSIAFMIVWGLAFGLIPYPKAKTDLPAEGTRFCRECANFLPQREPPFGRRTGINFGRCRHPSAMREAEDFLVRGYLDEDNMGYASSQRRERVANSSCGPDGRYWERKE